MDRLSETNGLSPMAAFMSSGRLVLSPCAMEISALLPLIPGLPSGSFTPVSIFEGTVTVPAAAVESVFSEIAAPVVPASRTLQTLLSIPISIAPKF